MYKRNINYAKSKHILTYFGCIAICIDLTVCQWHYKHTWKEIHVLK